MFRRSEDASRPSENEDYTGSQSSLLGDDSVKVIPQESSATSSAYSSLPGARSAASESVPAAPARAPLSPVSSSTGYRAAPASAQAEPARSRFPESKPATFPAPQAPAGAAAASGRSDSRRILTVGSDILLKGEIATCDRLVIEGKVDAVLNDIGTVELAETGSFKGVATVENAEISGLFEGELVVRGRLVVYASGRVRGKITYGEIEIERGGEITGEIKTLSSAGAASSTTGRSPARGERASSTQMREEKVEAA